MPDKAMKRQRVCEADIFKYNSNNGGGVAAMVNGNQTTGYHFNHNGNTGNGYRNIRISGVQDNKYLGGERNGGFVSHVR